jgi:ABC-type uncharacterized transport system ATPase subunit
MVSIGQNRFMSSSSPVLRLQGITKRFGALTANDGISLQLGAARCWPCWAKTAPARARWCRMLFGHYVADAGSIEVDGRPLPPGQPQGGAGRGIGMVHQHFTLADNLSVLDNVMLGTEPLWWPFSRRAAARAGCSTLARASAWRWTRTRASAAVGRRAPAGGDPEGAERRRSRRARAPQVLILDEPTAVLTPQESESLFATLRQMVAAGMALIFISHKLDEVLRSPTASRCCAAGRLVAELPAPGADKAMLAEAMVGRTVAPPVKRGAATRCAARWSARCRARRTGAARRRDRRHRRCGRQRAGGAGRAPVRPGARAGAAQGPQRCAAAPRDFVAAGVARIPRTAMPSA